MITIKSIIFFILLNNNFIINEFKKNKEGNEEIVIVERGNPILYKTSSYTECNRISYGVKLDFTSTSTHGLNPKKNISIKVFLVEERKNLFLTDASKLLQEYFLSVQSSGGVCEDPENNIMRLWVSGYARSTGEKESLVINLSNKGMIDYEVK